MKTILSFLQQAAGRPVFVDMDGTILKAFEIPAFVTGNKLMWWANNLDVTDVIWSRVLILVALKLMGSKLIIWTNRPESKKAITLKALGLVALLFDEMQFHMGKKKAEADMIVIDDDKRYKTNICLIVDKIK